MCAQLNDNMNRHAYVNLVRSIKTKIATSPLIPLACYAYNTISWEHFFLVQYVSYKINHGLTLTTYITFPTLTNSLLQDNGCQVMFHLSLSFTRMRYGLMDQNPIRKHPLQVFLPMTSGTLNARGPCEPPPSPLVVFHKIETEKTFFHI